MEIWKREDDAGGHPDPFMDKRREEHAGYTGLRYYLVALTEQGLQNLVVGYHVHPEHQTRSNSGGQALSEVVSQYWQQIQNQQTDSCISRLQKIRGELNTALQESGTLMATNYSLGRVFNDRNLAVPGDYFRDHGDGKLYAGNFHRFVGYGLWKEEYGYQPIKVCYCERPLVG